ncbi:MAG: helix-turn-helix transcriptional regulator [Myxococcales bacterium]|nr:helix-turn-helix transcriptional regulator [Myxococcales bacterium]MDD9967835.1 helix-turn-helix transcriptional regulator [Myxococcales bacterium]
MNPLVRHATSQFARAHGLTQRECDIFSLLVEGVGSASGLAQALRISENTINNHFKNLYRRTGTNSRTELMSLFIRESLDQDGQSTGLSPETSYEDKPVPGVVPSPRDARATMGTHPERALAPAIPRDPFPFHGERAS